MVIPFCFDDSFDDGVTGSLMLDSGRAVGNPRKAFNFCFFMLRAEELGWEDMWSVGLIVFMTHSFTHTHSRISIKTHTHKHAH